MTDKGIDINLSLVSGIAGRVEGKLGSGAANDYQELTGKLSVSSGNYAAALKEELAKEAAMVQEVHELLKEIARLVENASNDFSALDKKWSKSHLT